MNKLFCILAMLLVFAFSSQAANNRTFNRTMAGDVNGDNEVNIADISALIDLLVAGETCPAGDINGDGDITIADVNALIDMLLIGYVDPHDTGYWVILLDKDGEPVWHECYVGESGDYTATISLKDNSIYGTTFDSVTGVHFTTSLYVMIDGILYGAENDNQEIILGALYDNPLISNNKGYLIRIGFNYNVGVTFKDDDLYLYCAQCGWASN